MFFLVIRLVKYYVVFSDTVYLDISDSSNESQTNYVFDFDLSKADLIKQNDIA